MAILLYILLIRHCAVELVKSQHFTLKQNPEVGSLMVCRPYLFIDDHLVSFLPAVR